MIALGDPIINMNLPILGNENVNDQDTHANALISPGAGALPPQIEVADDI